MYHLLFNPAEYQEQGEYDVDPNPPPFPIILADSEEYERRIDEFGIPIHWKKITRDAPPTPAHSIARLNYDVFCSMLLMSMVKKAFAFSDWHPQIFKKMDDFIDNHCFHWIKEYIGQRRLCSWCCFSRSNQGLQSGRIFSIRYQL